MSLSPVLCFVSTLLLVTVTRNGYCFSEISKVNDIDKPIPVEEVTVMEGSTARLECDLRPNKPEDSAYLVLWYLETQKQPIYSLDLRARSVHQAKHWADRRLANRTEFSTVDPAALIFSNVSQTDAGVYRCRVDFRHSPTRHVRYRLGIVRPPRIPVIFGNEGTDFADLNGIFDQGTDLTLNCESTADSTSVPAQVSWFRLGEQLESRLEYLAHGVVVNRLTLYNLDRSHHNATYTCSAHLVALPAIPPASKSVTINVRLRPSSVEILVPVQGFLEAGRSHEIQCRSWGANPAASITWWANNRLINDSITSVTLLENGLVTLSSLRIVPANEDDGKILTCRAETPGLAAGVVEDSWKMTVFYQPQAAVTLGRQVIAEEIREGHDIYLECHIKANPPIHRLLWLHNGRTVSDQRKDQVVFVNQTLVLRQVGRHTAGNYSCVAINRQGETRSESLDVRVQYSPVCRRSGARTVGMSLQQTATLRCQVDADPREVTFHWTLSSDKETLPIPRNIATKTGLTSVLEHTPRRDSDFGSLKCWATNSIGNQKSPCVFEIVREGPPVAPSDCKLHLISESTLEVNCNRYNNNNNNKEDSTDGDDTDDVILSGPTIPQYTLELYDVDSGRLLRNLTSKKPRFRVVHMDLATRVAAVVSATNGQGRSERVTLEGAVQRAVGSREVNDPDSVATTVIFLTVPGVLFTGIVILGATFAALHHSRRRDRREIPQMDPGEMPASPRGQPDLIRPESDGKKRVPLLRANSGPIGEEDEEESPFSTSSRTNQYLV